MVRDEMSSEVMRRENALRCVALKDRGNKRENQNRHEEKGE